MMRTYSFDDPEHQKGDPEPGLFRAVYCSSSRAGAFGETISRFRKSLRLLSELREDEEPLDPELDGGSLPEEWRLNRRIGSSRLAGTLRFADLEAAQAATVLRREMAPLLAELGLDDLDNGAQEAGYTVRRTLRLRSDGRDRRVLLRRDQIRLPPEP